VLAIVFLLQQVQPDRVLESLSRAQPVALALVAVTVVASLITRAYRWQVLFLPARRITFGPLFGTLSISYMASTFLPFRAGELVRAIFLGRRAEVPIPGVVGTILLEKLFDFLAIGVMLLLLIGLTPLPVAATVAGATIASVILGGFGFVVALAIWRTPTLRFVALVERLVPLGIARKLHLERAARSFAQGTDSLRERRLWLLLLAWTTITWLCAIASSWAALAAVGIPFGWAPLLFVIVLTSTGQAVPSSPGYVGVYHAAAWFALTTFGVDSDSAAAFAIVTHALSYSTLVIVGLIALWAGGYSFGDMLVGIRTRPSGVAGRQPEPIPVAPDA
jgi:uncharacterized protein (TIRG00374 family)